MGNKSRAKRERRQGTPVRSTATRNAGAAEASRSLRPLLLVVAAVLALGLIGGGGYLAFGRKADTRPTPAASASAGPQATPSPDAPVAGVPDYADQATVNGIKCETMEQVAFHIHSHLAVVVSGVALKVPAGIGIAAPRQTTGTVVSGGGCFYWLHSHTDDGIIHIESPTQRSFNLGDYFAVWKQPLSATQVGPWRGTVIAYLNGQKISGDPSSIALSAHAVIQLDVNTDVTPSAFIFPSGL